MIDALLKQYPSYRPSLHPRLESIPSTWTEIRAKYVFREIDFRSTTGGEELLSVSHLTGVRRRADINASMLLAESNVGHKVCVPGDLVINTMWAWMGALAVSPYRGLVSPAYGVYRPLPSTNAASNYLHHLLRSPQYVSDYLARSTGLHSSRLRLYPDIFLRTPIVIPPPDEQAAIVRYVNHASRQIDRSILAHRQLIAHCNEQKRTIVEQAIRLGCNSDRTLFASGNPLIGSIPVGWRVARFKFETSHIVDCLHATPAYSSIGQYPAIRTADVEPGLVRMWRARRVDEAHYRKWTARMAPQSGDILYSREGERFGIAAPVPPNTQVCISQRMMAFRVKTSNDPYYMMWQLNCRHVYNQATEDLMGSTSPHVNISTIKNFLVIVPPIEEQRAVACHIRSAIALIDGPIAKAKLAIDDLREYRSRLIADIVTGKLDVRSAAASLPADADEPAPAALVSDSDDLDSDEEADI